MYLNSGDIISKKILLYLDYLNSTLKCNFISRQEGCDSVESAPFNPVRKRGTDENLQLILSFYSKHPRQDLTNLFYAGCQQFWRIRILQVFLSMHEKLFPSNPLLYLNQYSNFLWEALNGFPNFGFYK